MCCRQLRGRATIDPPADESGDHLDERRARDDAVLSGYAADHVGSGCLVVNDTGVDDTQAIDLLKPIRSVRERPIRVCVRAAERLRRSGRVR